jgi:hypothetical protein
MVRITEEVTSHSFTSQWLLLWVSYSRKSERGVWVSLVYYLMDRFIIVNMYYDFFFFFFSFMCVWVRNSFAFFLLFFFFLSFSHMLRCFCADRYVYNVKIIYIYKSCVKGCCILALPSQVLEGAGGCSDPRLFWKATWREHTTMVHALLLSLSLHICALMYCVAE